MSLIFQRSLPTPLSSQKCSPTPQINTQFGFFHSSPRLNRSSHPCLTPGPITSSSPLLMDSCWNQLNCLCEPDARMKEFMGRIYTDKGMEQRQYGCRNHQHYHRQENTLTCSPTIIKLLPSIINRLPASLTTTRILLPLLPLCLPPPASPLLLLGASSDTEMTNPSPSVWDIRRHNTST